jgi:hypothetical protein
MSTESPFEQASGGPADDADRPAEPSERSAPERGAAEEASGTPLTPTEEEVSRRPPSQPSGS